MKKTLKRNWQKIVVIRIHENGDGKRINTEDIKEPRLTKYRSGNCKIVSFCYKPHYAPLQSAKGKYNLD